MNTFPDPARFQYYDYIEFEGHYYHAADIINFGAPLSLDNLIEAYEKGIFPWSIPPLPLPWFCPKRRAILSLEAIHISKSLKKARNKNQFTFSIDRAFSQVIEACAETVESEFGNRSETWITPDFISSYCKLHEAGYAHSVEAWDREDNLIGGIYGVDAGGVFCGESMFYRRSNASKLALLFLVEHLIQSGSNFLDIQMMSPHMKNFGAIEVSRIEFLKMLATEQKRKLSLF